ncbi:MAG TPA: four-carbon acid sugar kinase family protein [Bryobacterales bacterium]|nr:four-carbon acid sugar kinase family protein [Bryobacterales bacterium]
MSVETSAEQRPGGARWGMIADDLTGACDAAVAFARQGFDTRVVLATGPRAESGAEMTVVSTDSRDDPPGVAAAKVSAACLWMKECGITVLFKKIDSVLRGNIRDEIEAVMASGGFQSAVMTPAFPAVGRTVRGGELRVFGSKQRAGESLATMFSGFSGAPTVKVSDAETDEDLRAIARSALRERLVPLLAGSGGLAGALAAVLASEHGRSASEACVPRSSQPPWVVIGTDHPATLAQVEQLEQAASAPERKQAAMLLTIPAERFEARTLQPLLDAIHHGEAGSLVVSGGDTARLLCGAIGAESIRLGGEVLAGVPWGRIEGGCADGMTIVTKSGGFGEPDALTRAVASLRREGEG